MGTILTKTLKVRVKDKHIPLLRRMASEVDFVWNYCNQTNRKNWRNHRQHLTGFDLNKLLDFVQNSDLALERIDRLLSLYALVIA